MSSVRGAPLCVTVEIELASGAAAGQRRFRLSRRVELPATLVLQRELPIEGQGEGQVRFTLPGGPEVRAAALLWHDPDKPEQGSQVQLRSLAPGLQRAVELYIEERTTP